MNRRPQWTLGLTLLALAGGALPRPAAAVTPDSPEVREVLKKAFGYLETSTDARLGGKCLIGLAYLKDGADETHPKVDEAVKSCLAHTKVEAAAIRSDIYSTGIAIIFLCTLNPSKYAPEILKLKESLELRQKPHGGWGYEARETGDTSMTQYGVLAYWEMNNVGFPPELASTERVTNWLLRTQAPEGNWGYQGKEGEEGARLTLVKQDSAKLSMAAAGLGSTYMAADLLKLTELNAEIDERLPPALKPAKKGPQQALTDKVNARWVTAAQERGRAFMRENYKIDPPGFTHYYLYALERFQSFYEAADGKIIKEPKWYNEGYAWLKKTQQEDGSWKGTTEGLEAVNTAFGVLFLLRSTKKAIQRAKSLGEGALVAGRGLPADAQQVRARGGRIVSLDQAITAAELLDRLASPEHADFAAAVADPELVRDKILAAKEADRAGLVTRLRRLAADGVPEARLAAVRTLALLRDLEGSVTLIAALDDPDWRVVIAADEGLRFIGRKLSSVDLGQKPNGNLRQAAIQHWKQWYLAVRPDAEFDN
jgi:hypothetical protein